MSQANYEMGGMKDSYGMYLDEIHRTPLLEGREEEVKLAKRIEAGLYAEHLLSQMIRPATEEDQHRIDEYEWIAENGREAKDHFIRANLGLPVSVARHYRHSNLSQQELVSAGNLGLIHAVEKFDYKRGEKFSTYACKSWIPKYMQVAMAEQGNAVKLPVQFWEKTRKADVIRGQLDSELGREPSVEELAAEMGVDADKAADLLIYGKQYTSLDKPLDEKGEFTLKDSSEVGQLLSNSAESQAMRNIKYEQLYEMIDSLDERSADIVRRRYGLNGQAEKLAEIADTHGITAERAGQLYRQAVNTLRAFGAPKTHQPVLAKVGRGHSVLSPKQKTMLAFRMQEPDFRSEDYQLSSDQSLALKHYLEAGTVDAVKRNLMLTDEAARVLVRSAVGQLEPLLKTKRSA